MWVKCINNTDIEHWCSVDTVYKVYATTAQHFQINDERGVTLWVMKHHFEVVKEEKKMATQLNSKARPCPPELHKAEKLAHAEGKTIQYFHSHYGRWQDCKNPGWKNNVQYRVKPETVEVQLVVKDLSMVMVKSSVNYVTQQHQGVPNVRLYFHPTTNELVKVEKL